MEPKPTEITYALGACYIYILRITSLFHYCIYCLSELLDLVRKIVIWVSYYFWNLSWEQQDVFMYSNNYLSWFKICQCNHRCLAVNWVCGNLLSSYRRSNRYINVVRSDVPMGCFHTYRLTTLWTSFCQEILNLVNKYFSWPDLVINSHSYKSSFTSLLYHISQCWGL